MRETIDILCVYNLVNPDGAKLQLRLGLVKGDGLRWSFEGKNIPMPVRSRTWFNGFPENIMLDWLKGNGWYPHTCVFMGTGKVKVYELPTAEDCALGQKFTAREMYNDAIAVAIGNYMNRIEEAKYAGQTSCYIHAMSGKPPVEAIEALMNAGYDITYHSYSNGYGDWFVQAFWHRSCKKGKIFASGMSGADKEVTIDDYRNA